MAHKNMRDQRYQRLLCEDLSTMDNDDLRFVINYEAGEQKYSNLLDSAREWDRRNGTHLSERAMLLCQTLQDLLTDVEKMYYSK